MKLYTTYSLSHIDLYNDYFVPSLPSELALNEREIPQDCPSGVCWSSGFDISCHKKIKYYKKACEDNQGDIIICSDIDVQFFGDVKDTLISELGDFDLACQDDGLYPAHAHRLPYCSGFMVLRCNNKTMDLLTKIDQDFAVDDQETLNQILKRYPDICQHKLLSNKFFTAGQSLGWRGWNGEKTFSLPDPVIMHHANYTFTIENKKKLLTLVKERVSAR